MTPEVHLHNHHTVHGWRAFLERAATSPEPMRAQHYAALDPDARRLYDQQRLHHLSGGKTIKTPLIDRIIKETRILLVANRHNTGAGQGIIVSGPPTTGKTTALLALGAATEHHIKQREPPNPDHIPVLFISLPPGATPKNISRAIAAFYGIHPPNRATFPELSATALGLMQTHRAQLLIVDEIHNLSHAHRIGAEASDFLKYLAERTQATMVYAGVEVENAGLFDGLRGRQLAGRFTLVPASPFSHATQQHRNTWTSLVEAFEAHLHLVNHKTGTLPRLSSYLYTRTGGHIGSLAHLVKKAAITAILDCTERITKDLLETIHIDIAAHRAEANTTSPVLRSA